VVAPPPIANHGGGSGEVLEASGTALSRTLSDAAHLRDASADAVFLKTLANQYTYLAEREGFEPVHLKGLQSESKGEKIPYDPLMPPDLCTDLCTTLGSGGLNR